MSQLCQTVQFWSPHHAKDIAKLEAVQRRATMMIPFLRNKSYEEKLARLNMFSLEKRSSEENLLCFKIRKGFKNVDANKLLSIDDISRTRSNGIKLRCRQIELDCTKFFFTNAVVRGWLIDWFYNKKTWRRNSQGHIAPEYILKKIITIVIKY